MHIYHVVLLSMRPWLSIDVMARRLPTCPHINVGVSLTELFRIYERKHAEVIVHYIIGCMLTLLYVCICTSVAL